MSVETMATFGRLLKEHRLAAGLTQEVLAEQAGVSVRAIQALERGESKPLRDTLQRLANALGQTDQQRTSFIAAGTPVPRRRAPAPHASRRRSPDTAVGERHFPGRESLPLFLTSFIGRHQELAEVTSLLRGARLLTLTGPGGTGKTRLALHLAADVRADFPEGMVFVPLAAISDPGLVGPAIAAALDVQQEEWPSLSSALVAFLRDRRLLLVLDNFEHIIAAAPFVGELLGSCEGLTIVVTSRMALHHSGEQEYAVPPLAVPAAGETVVDDYMRSPAVSLFADRAGLVRPGFALTQKSAPVVAEICRRLDGLPLAIELAAARVKLLAPDALLARLTRRLPLLTGGSRDLPARQQTLHATISWSYDLLDATEQMLFRRLSVFVDGWTLEAAERVCGAGDVDVLNTLSSLLDKSLLRTRSQHTGEDRYSFLETIREYAFELLRAGGELEGLQRRHTAYYVALAQENEPWPRWSLSAARLAWVEREQGNLLAAMQSARDRGEVENELHLAVTLAGHWCASGDRSQAIAWLEQPLGLEARHRDQVPPALRAYALGSLASTMWQQGDYEGAEARLEECLVLSRSIDWPEAIGVCLETLGHISREHGDYQRATKLYHERLALARDSDGEWALVRALTCLADLAREHGDAHEVVVRCEESLAIARRIGDHLSAGYALNNLALAAWFQGDMQRAEALFAEGLTTLRTFGFLPGVAEVLGNAGRFARDQGRLEQARSVLAESLALAQAAGPAMIVAPLLEALAGLAIARQPERAARLLGAAEALREGKRLSRWPVFQAPYERDVVLVRAALDAAAFEAAWALGRSMPLKDAIALALEDFPGD